MARSRYKIYHKDQPHFLTMTVVEWIPLFMDRQIAAILLRSLEFLQKERSLTIYAYVIMENHLHIIASNSCLNKTIKEFKSYTARSIVDYLLGKRSFPVLKKLEWAKLPHKIHSTHQVWQEGSHPQEIISETMLLQKIGYIHNNPIRRGYIDEPAQWRYSSARNYDGKDGLLDVKTDWRNEITL
ncbi:MAG: REP-associated tyrosine transposase [Bacteroidota bacterium]